NVSQTARRRRQHGPGARQEINRFHQRQRVIPSRFGQRRDHPRIAAFFLGLLQLALRPPHQRAPPIQTQGRQLHPADPMVAPPPAAPTAASDGIAPTAPLPPGTRQRRRQTKSNRMLAATTTNRKPTLAPQLSQA